MLCPGKSKFLKKVADLDKDTFRRLVDRRARARLGKRFVPSRSEETRRAREVELEKIDRDPNFLPAQFLSEGADRARAVCRISTRSSLGTGFLIARGILMTNNHVLETAAEAAESVAEFGFELGGETVVVPIQPRRLFMTDAPLDFTIVACDDGPLGDIAPIPLLRNPATVTRSERVSVIQHPRGRRKEVALHDNKVSRILNKVVHYSTDTEPGSSGSPVFNNAWELVALHHAGFNERGGRATNEGIRISAIVAHILGRSRESSAERESLRPVLQGVTDSSPYLGFFDIAGVEDPRGIEVEVPDFKGAADFADVGFWNIEHFNRFVSPARIDDVADVVERLSLDVLGLVEVEKGALDKLVAELARRGSALDFALLDVNGRQDLAVLYDKDTSKVSLRDDISRKHIRKLNRKTRSGKTAFPRHPLFAECRVQDGNGPEVRFIMIVVHLKAFGDSQSRARRRLAAEILAEIIEDIRASTDLPVVLGGDFNERIDNDVLSALHSAPDLFALTTDDAHDDAASYIGSSRRSLIDHIVVSRDAKLGEIQGDDAAIVRLDRSVRDFADKVSDHVPLVFRLVYRDEPIVIDEPPPPPRGLRLPVPEDAAAVRVDFEAGG